MIQVGLVGYGVIGKRVVDAVELQPDMICAGVAVPRQNARLGAARAKGLPIHHLPAADLGEFDRAGLPTQGSLEDLLDRSDIIVDCGPRGTGASRINSYRSAAVNTVFCGGEAHDLAGFTLCTAVNYEAGSDLQRLKVGSCNTIGVSRLIAALMPLGPITRIDATLVRSVSDADKAAKGFLGTEVVLGCSKHAADIQRIFPDVTVWTQAFSVPTNRGHAISLSIDGISPKAPVVDQLVGTPRIVVDRVGGSARLGVNRPISPMAGSREDHPELLVWEDSIWWDGNRLKISGWVHSESITIPETIDAVRLLGGMGITGPECAYRTDSALGGTRPLKDYVLTYGSQQISNRRVKP